MSINDNKANNSKSREKLTKVWSEDYPFESSGDVLEVAQQDEVFSYSIPYNNDKSSKLVEKCDNNANKSSEAEIEMLSLSPNSDEAHQSLRDTSMASTSSTPTLANSRTNTPLMDQTLSAAFRDKIRRRMKTAKHKVKHLSFRDEMFEKQEKDINEKMDSLLDSRSKWRQSIEKVLETEILFNKQTVPKDEAYDFFVNTNRKTLVNASSDTALEQTENSSRKESDANVIQVEDDTNKDTRVLVSDMFSSDIQWKVYESNPTIFKSIKQMISDEKNLLYFPSTRLTGVSPQDKQKINNFGIKNVNKLKNRIIDDNTKEKFLDESLCFVASDEPVNQSVSVILLTNIETDEKLVTSESYSYLKSGDNLENIDYFTANLHLDEINFTDPEVIENNARFRLLNLRWQGVPKFKGYRFVPLNEKEIPMDLFDNQTKDETSLKGYKAFEAKRDRAVKKLTKVRKKIVKQSTNIEDIIIEDDLPNISMSGLTSLITTGHTKRPLNPYRRERKKIGTTLFGNLDIKIIITIMHAFNVPVRRNENNPANQPFSEIPTESQVCPFVEAVFQKESAQTNTAEGPKPTWNESLCLKLKSLDDDYSPTSLTKITDCIYLNLFDEVLVKSEENLTDDGHSVLRNYTERRWLGSLKIPFSTLYLNNKIEGTFSLNTPTVLLGYEYDSKGWLLGASSGLSATYTNTDAPKRTYLTLFVTIDPSLSLPEPLAIKCDTTETESLTNAAKRWESKLLNEFPKRNIKALVVNTDTQYVCVTRYLRPLKPPEDLLINMLAIDEVMQRLARFVSLIPKVADSISLPGICDIWCTCDQFLEMLMGDEEEHAILLCNYFLYIGKLAAVVLGYGIPEGTTAYVIVFEYAGQDPRLWNASTGESFTVRDSYLPLNSIGCIIFPDNVYANISKQDHPNRLNYEMTKTSYWQPLFNKSFPMPFITSIQPEMLDYGTIESEYAMQLQEKLEKHLRESLMRWRKKERTFFNRHCIQAIRKILPRLEKKAGNLQHSDLIQDLNDILVVHEMTGFPLNMPYTDFGSISEAVFATGVHLASDKKVEFALAVYVHPYPNSIFSVWVYIAALKRHN